MENINKQKKENLPINNKNIKSRLNSRGGASRGVAVPDTAIQSGKRNTHTKENKAKNIKTFVTCVFLLIMGYKIYYFNLNLEFFFKNIDYNITDNIFLRGGNNNKLSEETFKNFFGSEISETLTANLKHTHIGWFDNYFYNLKLDFSYYFLKLMNVINKLKLTRYLLLSLFTGSFLFTGVMFILFFITCFFSIYGIIRVFTMEVPYFIFAALTPFVLMHIISIFMIIYYSIKLLFMKTTLPNGETRPNFDKLVILSVIFIYISCRMPNISDKMWYLKLIFILLGAIFPAYYTYKYDFFFQKDKEVIIEFFENNKFNFMYLIPFIICIGLFSIYS